MRRKITESDIENIHTLLYDKGLKLTEVALKFGYSDSSSFKKGLRSAGYITVHAVRNAVKI